MRKINFYKYHGLENDFLVIELSQVRLPEKLKSGLARKICHRNSGIGADGLIFLSCSKNRFVMRIFNADGSEAETSGNGMRIIAQHIYLRKLVESKQFSVWNILCENKVRVISSRGNLQVTEIKMGEPRFNLDAVPMRGQGSYFINSEFKTASGALLGTAVNVGNPHIVFFVDSADFDWQTYGVEVESDRRFPENTNVEFAIVRSRKHIIHWSWERGVGPTRASGTGAVSTVAAGIINGLLDHEVTVSEPAGDLNAIIPSLEGEILLIGSSVKVGEGEYLFNPHDT